MKVVSDLPVEFDVVAMGTIENLLLGLMTGKVTFER